MNSCIILQQNNNMQGGGGADRWNPQPKHWDQFHKLGGDTCTVGSFQWLGGKS